MSPFVFLHERWFVDMANLPAKDPFFTSWNDTNLAYSLAAIGIFIFLIVIHFLFHKVKVIDRLRKKLSPFGSLAPLVLRTFTGTTLFLLSIFPVLFAGLPDGMWRFLLQILAIFVSLAFITGIFVRAGAFLGMLFFLAAFFFALPLTILQYFFMFGIFLFYFISGNEALPKVKIGPQFRDIPLARFLKKWKPYTLALLRVATGISLASAALWNKIIDPRPALAFIAGRGAFLQEFIEKIHMTVPQFVLAAGLVELLIALLVFFGFLTRVCGLVLLAMFLVGIVFLGPVELIGHLPLIGIAFALLTLGGGEKWSFEK